MIKQTHWIYRPKVRAILETANLSDSKDGLTTLSGLDTSGAKALLELLEHLDPERLNRKQYHTLC